MAAEPVSARRARLFIRNPCLVAADFETLADGQHDACHVGLGADRTDVTHHVRAVCPDVVCHDDRAGIEFRIERLKARNVKVLPEIDQNEVEFHP